MRDPLSLTPDESTRIILSWQAAHRAGPSAAGGKSYQLGLLAHLGITVPPGFVINAGACARRSRGEALPAALVSARYTYRALVDQPGLWSRGNSRDVVPDPLTAMDWSVSRAVINRMTMRTYELAGYETLPAVQRAALRRGLVWPGRCHAGIRPLIPFLVRVARSSRASSAYRQS